MARGAWESWSKGETGWFEFSSETRIKEIIPCNRDWTEEKKEKEIGKEATTRSLR
jgi:hypothetical protein